MSLPGCCRRLVNVCRGRHVECSQPKITQNAMKHCIKTPSGLDFLLLSTQCNVSRHRLIGSLQAQSAYLDKLPFPLNYSRAAYTFRKTKVRAARSLVSVWCSSSDLQHVVAYIPSNFAPTSGDGRSDAQTLRQSEIIQPVKYLGRHPTRRLLHDKGEVVRK